MKKYTYDVPKGTRYISELEGIFEIPNEPCIIDKQLTGCGFTHWVINNNENVVLCSPRRLLLENKEEQNPHVLYVKNDFDREGSYEKDISTTSVTLEGSKAVSTEIAKAHRISMKNQIRNYLMSCNNPFHEPRPAKILVTYDSFRVVKEVLTELQMIDSFRFIVDEFQSIFVDSRFKSTTELGFVKQLQGIQKVCYVSATPMMEEYLDDMVEFKDLPYCQMDWGKLDPMRVMKPALDVKSINGKSISSVAKNVIKTYLDGEFEKTIIRDANSKNIEVESREAVFFVNSVKNILDIIHGTKLRPDQVNILCSNTPTNQAKINKRLNKLGLGKYLIGTIPTQGEPHKMFTFCTRTVYLGADFYSTNARTFVFSDANIDCLAVDITLDLPQILGRQRLECNPFRNKAAIYVKLLDKNKAKTKEETEELMRKKDKMTQDLMELFDLAETNDQRMAAVIKYEKDAKNSNYRDDYVAVDKHQGAYPIPVLNKLVRLSEKRAFEIQQVDYADRVQLFNSLENYANISTDVANFFFDLGDETQFVRRMKLLCEYRFEGEELDYVLKQLPSEYAKYYYVLGPDVIKSRAYNRSYLEKDYNRATFNTDQMTADVYSIFGEGEKLVTQEIVDRLGPIYEKYGNPNKPKGTDLREYFETSSTRKTITQSDGTKKVKDAFKLIRRLR